MDFLNGNIKPMYFKYLSAAFGSAMISSIYSIVDTAMVGQYHGPQGTAALAVVAPVWNNHLQPRPFGGHRRQRDFQHKAWQRKKRRKRTSVFYRRGDRRSAFVRSGMDRDPGLSAPCPDLLRRG